MSDYKEKPPGSKLIVIDGRTVDGSAGYDGAAQRAALLMNRAAQAGYSLSFQTALQLQAQGTGAFEAWLYQQQTGGSYTPPVTTTGTGGEGFRLEADRGGLSAGGDVSTTTILLGAAAVLGLVFAFKK